MPGWTCMDISVQIEATPCSTQVARRPNIWTGIHIPLLSLPASLPRAPLLPAAHPSTRCIPSAPHTSSGVRWAAPSEYLLLSWAAQHATCPPGELGRGTRAGRAASQIPAMQATWSRPPEHPPHHLLECPPVVGKGAWCPPGPPSLPVRERHSLGCTSGLPCAGEESSFCD